MSDLDMGHGVPEVLPGEIVAEDAVAQTTAMVAQELLPAVREPAAMQEVELLRMQQQYALEELMAGKSYSEAARTAGVHRRTLFRWVNHDPAFGAAMESWRRQVNVIAEDRLAQSAEDAATTLGDASRTDFRAAAMLLKGRGLLAGTSARVKPSEINRLLETIEPARWGEFEIRLRELIISFRDRDRDRDRPAD